MWHAFDIIATELKPDPELREAKAPGACRLVYGERVVRWFADKSGKGQWPAVVDHQPGIVLERSASSKANPAEWGLKVEHTRPQTVPAALHFTMTCASNAWRSPISWIGSQTLGGPKRPSPLGEISEHGRWDGRKATRTTQAGLKSIHNEHNTTLPTSVYSLLANFPAAEAKAGLLNEHNCDAVFTEGMQFMGDATMSIGAPGNAGEHVLADGLRCYVVTPSLGFPLEFWVNEYGVVIYLIETATRAWVLERVEVLT